MNLDLFENIEFNPFHSEGGYMWEVYPKLGKRKIFSRMPEDADNIPDDSLWYGHWTKQDLNNLIKFVILFLDEESPFYDERDFDVRKRMAYDALSLKNDSVVVQDIERDSDLFHTMMTEYFKIIMNHAYETWFTTLLNFRQMAAVSRRPISLNPSVAKDQIPMSATASTRMITLQDTLLTLEARLFSGDPRLKKLIAEKANELSFTGHAEAHLEDPY